MSSQQWLHFLGPAYSQMWSGELFSINGLRTEVIYTTFGPKLSGSRDAFFLFSLSAKYMCWWGGLNHKMKGDWVSASPRGGQPAANEDHQLALLDEWQMNFCFVWVTVYFEIDQDTKSLGLMLCKASVHDGPNKIFYLRKVKDWRGTWKLFV